MVILTVMRKAFDLSILAKKSMSFRGKRKRVSIQIFCTQSQGNRTFFCYRDKHPDALRHKTLDLQLNQAHPEFDTCWQETLAVVFHKGAKLDTFFEVHVGISNGAAIGVHKQYIDAVSSFRYLT